MPRKVERPRISEDPDVLGSRGHPVSGSARRGRLLGEAFLEDADEDA